MCIIDPSLAGYCPGYARLARNYCELGASDAKLAKFFAVTPPTIGLWMADIPAFAAAVRRGRAMADAEVVDSLHRRGTGYCQTVERVMVCHGKPVTVTYTKHHPPHVGAGLAWLENRLPEQWSRRPWQKVDAGTLLERIEARALRGFRQLAE